MVLVAKNSAKKMRWAQQETQVRYMTKSPRTWTNTMTWPKTHAKGAYFMQQLVGNNAVGNLHPPRTPADRPPLTSPPPSKCKRKCLRNKLFEKKNCWQSKTAYKVELLAKQNYLQSRTACKTELVKFRCAYIKNETFSLVIKFVCLCT
jgi:hypothetical protein